MTQKLTKISSRAVFQQEFNWKWRIENYELKNTYSRRVSLKNGKLMLNFELKPRKAKTLMVDPVWFFEQIDSAYKDKQFHLLINYGASENCFAMTNGFWNMKTDKIMFGTFGSCMTPFKLKHCVDDQNTLELSFKLTIRDAVGADYGTEFMHEKELQFDEHIYTQGTLKMLKDASFSDYEFVLRDGEKVAAHKFVLSARSEVFEQAFNAKDEDKEKELAIVTEVSNESFVKFLEIIYGSSIKISRENLTDFLFLSHKFKINDLKDKCEEAMEEELNPSTAIDFFKAATTLNLDEKLKIDSFKMIQKKFLKINQQLDDSFIDDPQYVLELVTKFQELLDSLKKRVRIEEKVEIAEN